ncbi:MAG: thioredoxin domain-containing protein [Anaerolineales bacterium]|nr:MAG: thioredoxin domain-containing protein [Anaerolineales bacterium]
MNSNKEISKRQVRREQIRRKEMRSRFLSIGLISIGALFLAFLFIYPNFKPVGEVTSPREIARTNVDFNAIGNPDAPIMIEEYSDFQCPYCRVFFENTEEALTAGYVADGTVYFVYKSFGDFLGTESGRAAEAAYCAGDQGRFWEMHDTIFANQTGENVGAYTDRRLLVFAENIELNMEEFRSCFNSGKYKDRIDQDMKDGVLAGIKATPSFVMTYTVAGETRTRIIEGAQPYSVFQQEIQAALAEMGQ